MITTQRENILKTIFILQWVHLMDIFATFFHFISQKKKERNIETIGFCLQKNPTVFASYGEIFWPQENWE